MLSNNMVAGDQADGPGHADIRGLSLPVPPSHPRPLICLNKRLYIYNLFIISIDVKINNFHLKRLAALQRCKYIQHLFLT